MNGAIITLVSGGRPGPWSALRRTVPTTKNTTRNHKIITRDETSEVHTVYDNGSKGRQ